jgi:hypothetical protein
MTLAASGKGKRGWCRSAVNALGREGRHINDRMHAIGEKTGTSSRVRAIGIASRWDTLACCCI